MVFLDFKDNKYFFNDLHDKRIMLADVLNKAENYSRIMGHFLEHVNNHWEIQYPLHEHVKEKVQKFPTEGSFEALAEILIYLRTVNNLLRKPLVKNVLHIGAWSTLDEVLDETLPKFHDENFLYCLTNQKPLQNFTHTNFIFVEGGKYLLPKNEFGMIVFSEITVPPDEVILAAKDFARVYFSCDKKILPEELKLNAEIYEMAENFSLIELTATPELKRTIFRRTERGILLEKKSKIVETVLRFPKITTQYNSLPEQERIHLLDEYIKDLSREEKVLAEIFPQLHSVTIKHNFNLLKEFLIDFRLRMHSDLQKVSADKIAKQYTILKEDLREDFS